MAGFKIIAKDLNFREADHLVAAMGRRFKINFSRNPTDHAWSRFNVHVWKSRGVTAANVLMYECYAEGAVEAMRNFKR